MNYQNLGFKSSEQYSFPNILNLSVIRGICPCRCIHCPVGMTNPLDREERFSNNSMKYELIKKIIDETSQYSHSTLRIHGVGEPLMWKGLIQALEYAYSKKVLTWLFTSLAIECNSILESLARYCNIIEISINSSDSLDYIQTKGIDAFNIVKNNLMKLRDISQSKELGTRILVSRVESENKSYDNAFIQFWKNSGLVDDAFIRSYHTYNSILPERFHIQKDKLTKCLVHWNRFNIDCDGKVVVCFNELFKIGNNPDIVLGDLNTHTIAEIWHSKKLHAIRLAFLSGDSSGLPCGENLPCIGCSSCQDENSNRQTSESQIINYRY
jgi:MoaA/NifB/PqqE/SkfB family radical SAM enzyme